MSLPLNLQEHIFTFVNVRDVRRLRAVNWFINITAEHLLLAQQLREQRERRRELLRLGRDDEVYDDYDYDSESDSDSDYDSDDNGNKLICFDCGGGCRVQLDSLGAQRCPSCAACYPENIGVIRFPDVPCQDCGVRTHGLELPIPYWFP